MIKGQLRLSLLTPLQTILVKPELYYGDDSETIDEPNESKLDLVTPDL